MISGESDEKPFRHADVAGQIRVLILDYFACALRAALPEHFKRLVDVSTANRTRRNLDTLIAQSSDTSCPFSFDRGPALKLEAELAKEINRPSEVIDGDSWIVHSFERYASNLQGVV